MLMKNMQPIFLFHYFFLPIRMSRHGKNSLKYFFYIIVFKMICCFGVPQVFGVPIPVVIEAIY